MKGLVFFALVIGLVCGMMPADPPPKAARMGVDPRYLLRAFSSHQKTLVDEYVENSKQHPDYERCFQTLESLPGWSPMLFDTAENFEALTTSHTLVLCLGSYGGGKVRNVGASKQRCLCRY